MPTIPDMIRSGRGEFSSASLLRDGVAASGACLFSNDRLAAADRIETLEGVLRDIAEGRGMFGARAKDDLIWAMEHAGKAINLEESPCD
jgi:hypothetical protein